MYLQRDAQFLLNNEITCAMPFYLHHSRSWATLWPSLYHFPLKRVPTIFLNFDTSSINSPYFAPFSFVQVSSCKLETNENQMIRRLILQNKYHICLEIPSSGLCWFLSCAFFFFHRIFWIFLQNKTRRNSQWETVILISNRTFCEKLLVMCLNGAQSCLQHLTTYLYYSKSYFQHIATSNISLFACFCYRKTLNLKKNRSTFKSYMQFLNVIIHMQVALALMAYQI